MTILSPTDASPSYVDAVTAASWAAYNSVYVVGDSAFQQTRWCAVQTGTLCTSQEGGAARLVDYNLKDGIIGNDDDSWFDRPACCVVNYSDDLVTSDPRLDNRVCFGWWLIGTSNHELEMDGTC